MKLEEQPPKFLIRVDQMVKELERVDGPMDAKNIDIIIVSGFTPQYDAEVRNLIENSQNTSVYVKADEQQWRIAQRNKRHASGYGPHLRNLSRLRHPNTRRAH